jgi:hypothetical protein
MKSARCAKLSVAMLALAVALAPRHAASEEQSESLAPPESFSAIADQRARSAALFTELGRVLTHPRCINCHPAGDHPRQGEGGRPHQPPVARGDDGHGLAAMRCSSCHQRANFEPGRIPGHPEWHLAPRAMAWEGRSLAAICEQLKDPTRNGNRSLQELAHHMSEDTLVGWAWAPGFGRRPAPGTQKQAGALFEAWVKTGANARSS